MFVRREVHYRGKPGLLAASLPYSEDVGIQKIQVLVPTAQSLMLFSYSSHSFQPLPLHFCPHGYWITVFAEIFLTKENVTNMRQLNYQSQLWHWFLPTWILSSKHLQGDLFTGTNFRVSSTSAIDRAASLAQGRLEKWWNSNTSFSRHAA